MSKLSKQHHQAISIAEDIIEPKEYDEFEDVVETVRHNCNYDCYFCDCGLECPDECCVWKRVTLLLRRIDCQYGLNRRNENPDFSSD